MALIYLRFRPAIPALIALAGHDDFTLVFGATRGLSFLKSRRATRSLMQIVRNSTREEVRNAVLNAIGSLSDKRAEEMLRGILKNSAEAEYTRQYAAQALGSFRRLRHHTIKSLVSALKDPSPAQGDIVNCQWSYPAAR